MDTIILSDPAACERRTLPDGFNWIPRGQYALDELALLCNGRHVAMLMKRVDGETWMARLDCHQHITAPVVTRPCTSFESGKAGIEAWAARHQAALRAGACVYQQADMAELRGSADEGPCA